MGASHLEIAELVEQYFFLGYLIAKFVAAASFGKMVFFWSLKKRFTNVA
jgi:hypothetical protein